MKTELRRGVAALLTLCLVTSTSACGSGAVPAAEAATMPPQAAAPAVERERPECRVSAYHPELAEAMEGVEGAVDCSALSEGYVALSVTDGKRLKFRVTKGEESCTYDLPGDGTPTVYPVNLGEGRYTFELMRCISGTKYARVWTDTREVALEDEFSPWLLPSQMVPYDADSECVEKAWELTRTCGSDVDIAGEVYRYLVEELSYDDEKAQNVAPGYLPDPDATLAEKKGICFDYAALAAAMLRSQGIPCQLITGYVGEEGLYHAWNRFYLKEQGWITAEIQAKGSDWKRVDITFASEGVSDDRLEDDSSYTPRNTY